MFKGLDFQEHPRYIDGCAVPNYAYDASSLGHLGRKVTTDWGFLGSLDHIARFSLLKINNKFQTVVYCKEKWQVPGSLTADN